MLERWSHYAALPLRIVLGCSFVVLGLQKLGGYFDGPGLARTAEWMASGGLMPGAFWAWIVGLLELLGGATIVLGLLTRWAALVLALESLVATIAAWQVTNVEFRLTALAAFAAGAPGTAAVRAGPEVAEARVVVASRRHSRARVEGRLRGSTSTIDRHARRQGEKPCRRAVAFRVA